MEMGFGKRHWQKMIVSRPLQILTVILVSCNNIDSLLFRLYYESVTSKNQEAYGLNGTHILHGFYAIGRLHPLFHGLWLHWLPLLKMTHNESAIFQLYPIIHCCVLYYLCSTPCQKHVSNEQFNIVTDQMHLSRSRGFRLIHGNESTDNLKQLLWHLGSPHSKSC